MKILLTNDDGYGAAGIETLRRGLSAGHEVYMFAPAFNMSGASNSIHMDQVLDVKKLDERTYTVSGSPADCIMVALKGGLVPRPDVILSGINKGANIGTDVVYSGTCGAARQGVLSGIPSVALSIDGDFTDEDSIWKYDALASFASANLEKLMSLCSVANLDMTMPADRCVFVNVNGASISSYKGVKFTGLAFREYCNDGIKFDWQDKCNAKRHFVYGSVTTASRCYSDYEAVKDGFISVTRVFAEPEAAGPMDGIEFSL